MNLFGTKKKAPAPKLSDSIQALREAINVLDKREKHLEKQIEQTLDEAKKKAKAKDKRGALFHLKRKKMLEKQIDQIYGKKTNIEMQVMALESAAGNKEVLAAMRLGKDALKGAIQESDIDRVDDVMAEIGDSLALADELGDAMSRPIGNNVDEDELNQELEQMESELLAEDMLEAPKVPVVAKGKDVSEAVAALPSAPSHAPARESKAEREAREAREKEENDLKELDAMMNA